MRYNKIRKMDISNGPGVRVSIFMQGCSFNCKNCFNKETHDFNGGKDFNDETVERVLELCDNDKIEGLSILGGEPLDNLDVVNLLIDEFKKNFKDKNIWLWSGYTYEEILTDKNKLNIISKCDILVDGKFINKLKNNSLKFRGSTNQRIINVQESLKQNKVIEYDVVGI